MNDSDTVTITRPLAECLLVLCESWHRIASKHAGDVDTPEADKAIAGLRAALGRRDDINDDIAQRCKPDGT